MTAKQLAKDIRNFCIANADGALVKKYSRYFKEGVYDAYGISGEKFNAKLNELLSRKDVNLDLIFETAPLLLKSGKYEETSFAIMLFNSFNAKYEPQHFMEISKWFAAGITNWAHADILGMQVLPWFIDNEVINYDALVSWISSTFKFQRRAVPVTLIKSLKNESSSKSSYTELFRFIEPLMTDKEREVQQGVGWFLREAWKRKPEETEKFLIKWKDKSPRLIYQYACEKMDKKRKERFRKSK